MLTMVGSTDIGRRSLNEDCFLADPRLGLAVVADGMGGHQHGEVASAIVVEILQQEATRGSPLSAAIQLSHSEVKRAALDGRGGKDMGAAVVAAVFTDHDYEIGWVGDCRAYLWDGELVQLTRDHSHVEAMLSSDSITWEEAQSSSVRNLITQAVGVSDNEELRIGSVKGTLGTGQELLLCSDGLNDVLSGQQIGTILSRDASARERCEQLVATAVGAGGKDNITALLIAPDPGLMNAPSTRPSPVSVSKLDGVVEYFTASGLHVYNPQDSTNSTNGSDQENAPETPIDSATSEEVDVEKTGVRMLSEEQKASSGEAAAAPKKRRLVSANSSFMGSVFQGLAVGGGLIGLIVGARWLWSYFSG
jgi:serine/threonine protein phosphatase PrpC